METYMVTVRNEQTGEIRVVEVVSGYPVDAQVQALHLLFREARWHQATALVPPAPLTAPL